MHSFAHKNRLKEKGGFQFNRTINLVAEAANKKNTGSIGVVPPVVNEVISSPGQPLEDSARSYFEPRFGHDFSRVRVHTGDKAGTSALAIGARAYTVGPHMVFGPAQYAPGTGPGRQLLAHELTHVVQQGLKPASTPFSVAPAQDNTEQFAESASTQITAERPAANASAQMGSSSMVTPGSTIQRSLLGGILGGIGGAIGGAVLGGMIGGPIGAIVGGVVGLIGGALIGDDATTKSRSLNQPEIDYAKDIFKDSIDYSKIKITRDSMLSTGAPRTIGNTIHLRSDWGHFKKDTLELTDKGMETLIHEMGHVWQYQNGGIAYIPESLWAQLKATITGQSRNAAYDWRSAHAAKIPWEKWNPEQQASAIEDYNIILRKSKDGTATVAELSELSTLLPYMDNVWKRKGAPTFSVPAMTGAPF